MQDQVPATQEAILETPIQENSISQPAVGVRKQPITTEYISIAGMMQFHRDTYRAKSVILEFFSFFKMR